MGQAAVCNCDKQETLQVDPTVERVSDERLSIPCGYHDGEFQEWNQAPDEETVPVMTLLHWLVPLTLHLHDPGHLQLSLEYVHSRFPGGQAVDVHEFALTGVRLWGSLYAVSGGERREICMAEATIDLFKHRDDQCSTVVCKDFRFANEMWNHSALQRINTDAVGELVCTRVRQMLSKELADARCTDIVEAPLLGKQHNSRHPSMDGISTWSTSAGTVRSVDFSTYDELPVRNW